MVMQIWEDPEAAFLAIDDLLNGRLGITYTGWQVRGPKPKRSHHRKTIAVVAFWPYRPMIFENQADESLIPHDDLFTGGLMSANTGSDQMEMIKTIARVIIADARFRPEALSRIDAYEQRWITQSPEQRAMDFEMARLACDQYGLPLSCMVISRSEKCPQDYLHFWHSRAIPPRSTLSAIRSHFTSSH